MSWSTWPMSSTGPFHFLRPEDSDTEALRTETETLREMVRILLKLVQDRGGPTAAFVEEVHRVRLPKGRSMQEDRDFVMFLPDGTPSTKFTFGPGARWFRYARYTPALHDPPEKLSPAMARVAALLYV